MADDDQVVLQSQDGQDFKVTVKVAKMNNTIRDLIADAGVEAPIPLPNVTGKILTRVVEYCSYHVNDAPKAPVGVEADEKRTDDIIGWDLDFCKPFDQPTLFNVILAANYMDNQPLLDLMCKTVANMIKGKTPDEIRKTFNITEEFTPEEEEQVRKENDWCLEK